MPKLEERDVPVLLPSSWLRSPSRVRVNLTARSRRPASARAASSPTALARFDWRLAVGDVVLTDEELAELAAAKEPYVRVGGRWHALRRADVERALRFLERRRSGTGIVELVRAVSGLETDEAGLELGEVRLDATLADLLGGGERRFRPLPTPAAMTHRALPVPGARPRLAADARRPRVGAILADDMGLGKTVQAIAMLASEREERGRRASRADARRLPDERRQAVGRRDPPFRALAARPPPPRPQPPRRTELAARRAGHDVVVTSYDIATRDVDALAAIAWDRLLLDEAQDVKNPATKRARALRRLQARRKVAMTGTPIENRLGELWAIMDIVNPGLLGSRERFDRAFARPIEQFGDEGALERLRSIVDPFVLRRREGLARDRARAAADHDREGLLPPDGRAGEPLPGDGRSLAARWRRTRTASAAAAPCSRCSAS